MGIRGLTTFCAKHEAQVSTHCPELRDVTLAVDCVGFLFDACEKLFRDVQDAHKRESSGCEALLSPQAWLLLGGCPDRLEQYLEEWLATLRASNISLVFVADPPQCFGGEDHRKSYCQQDRAQHKADKIRQLGQMLFVPPPPEAQHDTEEVDAIDTTATEPIAQPLPLDTAAVAPLRLAQTDWSAKLLHETNGCFPFAREKLRTVLTRHGIPIVTATREADEELADLVRSGDAYAVLARDSDFLCMRGVRYIPFANLAIDYSAQTVTARVFTPELVAAALKLRVEQLVDLALVCSNDLSPLLDAQFDMATRLNFPVQRVLSGTNAVFPKDAAQWITRQLPLLDNPVLAQMETETPGLLRALFEVYRFYGYAPAFLDRYPLEIAPALPPSKLAHFKTLLDAFAYPPSAIDLIETRMRTFSNRFDPLVVARKSIAVLIAPLRHLEYAALGAPHVREFAPGDDRGHVVTLAPTDALTQLLAVPLGERTHATVRETLRDMIVRALDLEPTKAARAKTLCDGWSIAATATPAQATECANIATVAYALLVLQRRDSAYLADSALLTRQRIQILLLTSLICLHQSKRRNSSDSRSSTHLEPVAASRGAMDWSVYSTVAAYLAALKQLFHVRVILGEAQPLACPTFFSSDVFVRVCDALSDGRGVQAAWDALGDRAITPSHVAAMLSSLAADSSDSVDVIWEMYLHSSITLANLIALLPAPQVVRAAVVPPVVVAAPSATDSLPDPRDQLSLGIVDLVISGRSHISVPAPPKPLAVASPSTPPVTLPAPESQASAPAPTPEQQVPAPAPVKTAGFSALTPASVVKRVANKKTKAAKKAAKAKKSAKASNATSSSAPLSPRSVTSSTSSAPTNAKSTAPATTTTPASPPPSLQGLMATLPVFKHRHEILENVANNQITIIQGETGCGKSTSVPQFLLDAALASPSPDRPVNIYVTQPRRIAAIELANTVASMRKGNAFGDDGRVGGVIGYRIGQKQLVSSRTKITYVTTGYMVERLIHDPNALASMTHLVLDEVHERSMDVDLLLLLLRLQLNEHPHVRLVIMSATMDAKVILKYFASALTTRLQKKKPLFVGSKLFPVEHVYLDDLDARVPTVSHRARKEIAFIESKLQGLVDAHERANSEVAVARVSPILDKQLVIVVELIQLLIATYARQQAAQCILVFLPGIGAINALFETLSVVAASTTHERVSVFVLHSALELEHQQEAFQTIRERSTKIILSTNIAESSVTIPDVTHVINCGIEKQIDMPNAGSSHAEVLIDSWCSQASAKQRAGRAGRVMPGTAYHLFTRSFYDTCMLTYSTPEMLRKPLDRIILLLKGKMSDFGTPSALLTKAMDAPELASIDGAYKLLAHFDAIDSADEGTAKMTTFGSFVCQMPLNLHLCRLVMTGMYLVHGSTSAIALQPIAAADKSASETSVSSDDSVADAAALASLSDGENNPVESWQLLLHVVILAAVLGVPDLFLAPSFYHATSATKYLREMKASLKAKLAADDGVWSEPLAVWRMYLEILALHTPYKRPNLGSICHKRAISLRRYQTLNFLISDLCNRLVALQKHNNVFSAVLDTKAVTMLLWLDAYASSQRVDDHLLAFASAALDGRSRIDDVLRFLVVHNYDEHLIGGSPEVQATFSDDDLTGVDRVDLKIDNDAFAMFSKMKSRARIAMFEQLASASRDASGASSSTEFSAIAYDGRTVSLYTFASGVSSSSSGDDDDADGSTLSSPRGYHDLLPRMSFPVSLLYYVRDQRFPVDFGVPAPPDGESNSLELKVRVRVGDCNGSSLTWIQQKDNVKVTLGGRNVFSLPVRLDADDSDRALPHQKLHAVYAERMFTGSEARMYCNKCTLLPPGSISYYPMMLLLSARRASNVWLFVNDVTSEIVTIKVDGHVVVLPPKTGIRLAIIDAVNVVRQALSDALNGVTDAPRVNAADLLALADDRNFVVRGTKAKKATFSWRQARMPALDAAARKDLEARGVAASRFPPMTL